MNTYFAKRSTININKKYVDIAFEKIHEDPKNATAFLLGCLYYAEYQKHGSFTENLSPDMAILYKLHCAEIDEKALAYEQKAHATAQSSGKRGAPKGNKNASKTANKIVED